MGFFYCFAGKPAVYIGRAKDNDIIIDDTTVSRKHLSIEPLADKRVAEIKVVGANGVFINDRFYQCGEREILGLTDVVRIGNATILLLNNYLYICNGKSSTYLNVREFISRECMEYRKQSTFVPAVRQQLFYDKTPIEIEGPPSRRAPEKPSILFAAGPALTMALPILLGAGRRISIITSIAAALWAVGNVFGRHRKLKNEEKRRRNSYYGYIDACEQQLINRKRECVNYFQKTYPPVDKYLEGGGNPFIVWNKDLENTDGFMIRLGLGERDNPIPIKIPKEKFTQLDDSLKELPAKLKKSYEKISKAPICINGNSVKVIGFWHDNSAKSFGILSSILLQFMVLFKPNELLIYTEIQNESIKNTLMWLQFSPHYSDNWEDMNTKLRGRNENEDMNTMLRGRHKSEVHKASVSMRRLLITDRTDMVSGFMYGGKSTVILLKKQLVDFSAYVDCIVSVKKNFQGIIKLYESGQNRIRVKFDCISRRLSEEYARQLFCMWKTGDEEVEDVPQYVSFGNLFADEISLCEKDDVFTIVKTWREADVRKTIGFPIGISSNNEKLILDLHERKHGPHGIIAGTTGSGKSELLTTMILSAALMYPPDKLGFFLIDYKGGGMSNLFGKLPHLMGSISNLSQSESYRAMISIQSENLRRQNIFLSAGVNNINDYIKLYDEGKIREPMPHVFIVIDEFAELKKEQPEYMGQLISVAAVGRSLGIHLILATQKPAGVVDDKIRSNSRFRICLRVEDKSDSQDMLHKPDASYVKECGRGYFQVGNDEVYEMFQSAYAMGCVGEKSEDKPELYDSQKNYLESDDGSLESGQTWHMYCLNVINKAVLQYETGSLPPLWMPSLPNFLCEEDINELGNRNKDMSGEDYAIGMVDNPYGQCYQEMIFTPALNENIACIGPPGSGKSMFLTTILMGVVRLEQSKDTGFYIIDGGGGLLEEFSRSRRCGGYVTPDAEVKVKMLLLFIDEVIRERRGNCRTGNYGNFNDSIILIVDNYAECFANCCQEAEAVINDIQKYGKNTGVSLLVTANNVGQGEIPSRILGMMDRNLAMGINDVFVTSGMLRVKCGDIPKIACVPGRGVGLFGEKVLEFQMMYPGGSRQKHLRGIGIKNGAVGNEISSVIERENTKNTHRMREYPHIPDDRSVSRLIRQYDNCTGSVIPIGYDEYSGKIATLDFNKIPCVIISGREGTGKEDFLKNISEIISEFNFKVIHIDGCENVEKLCSVLSEDEKVEELCSALSEDDKVNESLFAIISDIEKFAVEIENSGKDEQIRKRLSDLFDNSIAARRNIYVIGMLSIKPGNELKNSVFFESIMRRPYVIYFGGCLDEQRLFDFSYLPYSVQTKRKMDGYATVLKYDDRNYYGNLVVPEREGD